MTCKLLSDSCLTVFRVVKTPTLKTPKAMIVRTRHRKDYLIHELEFVEIEDCAFSAGEIIAVAA